MKTLGFHLCFAVTGYYHWRCDKCGRYFRRKPYAQTCSGAHTHSEHDQ